MDFPRHLPVRQRAARCSWLSLRICPTALIPTDAFRTQRFQTLPPGLPPQSLAPQAGLQPPRQLLLSRCPPEVLPASWNLSRTDSACILHAPSVVVRKLTFLPATRV